MWKKTWFAELIPLGFAQRMCEKVLKDFNDFWGK